MEPVPLTAFEQLEKQFIAFVLAHTGTLEEAARFLNMNVSTLREKRKTYDLPTPPPHHYAGRVLSHEEMFEAFRASLVPSSPATLDLEALARAINVTLTPPGGPPITVPLSSVLPQAIN